MTSRDHDTPAARTMGEGAHHEHHADTTYAAYMPYRGASKEALVSIVAEDLETRHKSGCKHVSTQTDDSSVPSINERMVVQLVTSVSELVSSKVLTEHIRPLFAALRDDIVASVTETILQLSEHIVAATDRSLQPAHAGESFTHEQHGSSSFGSAQGAHPAVKDTVMGSLRGFWSAIQQEKTSGDDAGTTANSHSSHCVHLRMHIGPSLLGAETAFMKELEAALKKEHIRLSRTPSAGVPAVSLVLHRGGSRTQRTMEDMTATYAHLTDPSSYVEEIDWLVLF